MEITLTAQNFPEEVLKSKIPMLVYFWAEWCTPCHAIGPVVSELAQEYEGRIKIGKLNVDEYPELAQRYQIHSIPNMKIFKDGQVVDEVIGTVPKAELKSRIVKSVT